MLGQPTVVATGEKKSTVVVEVVLIGGVVGALVGELAFEAEGVEDVVPVVTGGDHKEEDKGVLEVLEIPRVSENSPQLHLCKDLHSNDRVQVDYQQ